MAAAFFGSAAVGHAVGLIPGDLSENARGVLYVPPMLVFFMGYATWMARLQGLAFTTITWGLLKALFRLAVRRQKPSSVADVLPSRDDLLKMAVLGQKAGASFAPIGWLVGLPAAGVASLFDSQLSALARFALVAFAIVAWGHVLARLGRRGWLPFPEGE
jgi:hypothetical protein